MQLDLQVITGYGEGEKNVILAQRTGSACLPLICTLGIEMTSGEQGVICILPSASICPVSISQSSDKNWSFQLLPAFHWFKLMSTWLCFGRIIRTKVQQPFHPTPDGSGTGVAAPGHTIGKRKPERLGTGEEQGDLLHRLFSHHNKRAARGVTTRQLCAG